MPRPLHLGPITYSTRDYVVVELTASSGLRGSAIGYSRGTPLLGAIEILAAHLPELPTNDPSETIRTLRGRFAPGWGAMVRGASLIEIALRDLRARREGTDLATSLGGRTRSVPLMAVAGYFLDQRGRGEIVDEVDRFLDLGFRTIKLIVPGHDRDEDVALVSAVQAKLRGGADLAIDFHGAFPDPAEAVRYAEAFRIHDLRFIEDPFSGLEVESYVEAAPSISTPLAAGEDVVTPSSYDSLIRAGARYLRVDATASGGYSAALHGVRSAERAGVTVAPHVWPHIHHPLAAVSEAVGMIEVIPHTTGADPLDLIMSEPFPVTDGAWNPPDHTGLYLPIDWPRVRALASDSVTWSASGGSS